MAETVYDQNGVTLTTYVGPLPHRAPHSNSRMMVQLTVDNQYVQLTMDQWIDLVCLIRRMDRAGTGILNHCE